MIFIARELIASLLCLFLYSCKIDNNCLKNLIKITFRKTEKNVFRLSQNLRQFSSYVVISPQEFGMIAVCCVSQQSADGRRCRKNSVGCEDLLMGTWC